MGGACSHGPQNSGENSPEYRTYQAQAESNAQLQRAVIELKTELKEDLRRTVREEILPVVEGAHPVPKEVREKQLQAKNSALEKVILGRVEWVTVESQNIRMRARIDSGAASSSIHAENVVEKVNDGKTYVQFATVDDEGKVYLLFKEVVKTIKVRSASGLKRRYVVKMKVILGGKEHEINVNLIDREEMTYKFLVGRNLLMGRYIIDVSQSRILGK
jgi:hypothetical protein